MCLLVSLQSNRPTIHLYLDTVRACLHNRQSLCIRLLLTGAVMAKPYIYRPCFTLRSQNPNQVYRVCHPLSQPQAIERLLAESVVS